MSRSFTRRKRSVLSTRISIGIPTLIILCLIYLLSTLVEVSGDLANGFTFGLVVPAQVVAFFTGIGGNLAQAIIFTIVLGAIGGRYVHRGSFQSNQYAGGDPETRAPPPRRLEL